jgi:hypothetical protein
MMIAGSRLMEAKLWNSMEGTMTPKKKWKKTRRKKCLLNASHRLTNLNPQRQDNFNKQQRNSRRANQAVVLQLERLMLRDRRLKISHLILP